MKTQDDPVYSQGFSTFDQVSELVQDPGGKAEINGSTYPLAET